MTKKYKKSLHRGLPTKTLRPLTPPTQEKRLQKPTLLSGTQSTSKSVLIASVEDKFGERK